MPPQVLTDLIRVGVDVDLHEARNRLRRLADIVSAKGHPSVLGLGSQVQREASVEGPKLNHSVIPSFIEQRLPENELHPELRNRDSTERDSSVFVPSVYSLGYVIAYTRPASGGAAEQRRRCSEIPFEISRCLCSAVMFQSKGT